jgi:hypothetical protein
VRRGEGQPCVHSPSPVLRGVHPLDRRQEACCRTFGSHPSKHIPAELAEDKTEDLLILGIPLFVCRIGNQGLLAVPILALDVFSRGRHVTGEVPN